MLSLALAIALAIALILAIAAMGSYNPSATRARLDSLAMELGLDSLAHEMASERDKRAWDMEVASYLASLSSADSGDRAVAARAQVSGFTLEALGRAPRVRCYDGGRPVGCTRGERGRWVKVATCVAAEGEGETLRAMAEELVELTREVGEHAARDLVSLASKAGWIPGTVGRSTYIWTLVEMGAHIAHDAGLGAEDVTRVA